MAIFVFSCCNRSVIVPDTSASPITMNHLCLGDVPCIGVAYGTVNVVAASSDVQTQAVDPVTGVVDGTDGGTVTNGDGN